VRIDTRPLSSPVLALVAFGAGCGPTRSGPTPDLARACTAEAHLPIAESTSAEGLRYCGAVCLEVAATVGTRRVDLCAGTLDVRIQDDTLTGTGACRYVGIEGEAGLASLFPEDQHAVVDGQRSDDGWTGQVTVYTSAGTFGWDWTGTWNGLGTPLSGAVFGSSLVDLGQSAVEVSGDGWFEASTNGCDLP